MWNLLIERVGPSNFYKLLFRREWPYFYAFDMLALNGAGSESTAAPRAYTADHVDRSNTEGCV